MHDVIGWRTFLRVYLSNGFNYLILLLGTLLIAFFDYLGTISTLEYKKFLLVEVISPILIYFLLLINCCFFIHPRLSFIQSVKKVLQSIISFYWIISLKLAWNFCNYCIMGLDYTPDPELGLLPIFLLTISWLVILLFAAYVIPRRIDLLRSKYKFSFSNMFSYLGKKYRVIFKCLIYSFATVTILLFLITFLLSYFHPIFCFFCSSELMKLWVEKVLFSLMYVLYSQLMMIFFCYVYKSHSPILTRKG